MTKRRKYDREGLVVLWNKIVNTPMEELQYEDFKRLKFGRDKYSEIPLSELKKRVNQIDYQRASEVFDKKSNLANCLRHLLRGLPLNKAIRKVKTDLDHRKNAIHSQRRKGAS